jgi:hypothetical protein
MWAIIELILIAGIVLVAITEFFWPLITGKPLFGSFRKSKSAETKIAVEGSYNEKISKAKAKVQEVKDIQNELNENFKSAEQLKKEADDLLK